MSTVNATGASEVTQAAILNDADSLQYLRRIVALLESQANVDSGGRQRVTVDAFANNAILQSLTTVATVSTVNNVATIASLDNRMYQDTSQTMYNTGIRSQLAFS